MLFHENILPFKGFIVKDGIPCPLIVTEWMENGSLKDYMSSTSVDAFFMVS